MSHIKVSDFGPVKAGFEANGGWLPVHKVTVFIGNQGSGKSTVAKLISTFTWLEKALYRGDLKESDVTRKNKFEDTYCGYHRLKNYFQPNTLIEYRGAVYAFRYSGGKLTVTELHDSPYMVPKIMYVPAERNFLSAVSQPEKLKGLPLPLYDFLEEYDRSQQELDENLLLPIGNLKFQYQKTNKTSNILGDDYKIRLLEASSGLQSAVPLFLVSRNLALSINKEADTSRKEISVEEEKRMKAEIEKIMSNDKLTRDMKQAALEVLSSRYRYGCFINIVEEIEQNLFPQSQKDLLFKLLEFTNLSEANELILTTHSPYIINHLILALKGYSLLDGIRQSANARELLGKLEAVVPASSCVAPEDTVVYELTEEGAIKKLPEYEGLPSDENFLNTFLADTNLLFDSLLEIEDTL